MQDHLKERLTGAAILVVVVVLLVPEMFSGRPASGVPREGAGPEGPPLRTYTIDLRDSPSAQPPEVAPPPMTVAEAAGREAPGAAGLPGATPAAPPTAAPPTVALPTVALPTVAPTVAPKVAATVVPAARAGGAASGWTVQVGSFSRRDFAERMVKQVKGKGFAVEAAGPDDRGLYRVRSAALPERAAALALKQKMLARGLKPIINKTP